MGPPGWLVGPVTAIAALWILGLQFALFAMGGGGLLLVAVAAFWLGAAVAAVIDPQRQGRNAMIVAISITVCLSAYVISLMNVASRPVPPGAAQSGANVYPPQSPNVPP